MGQLRYLGWIGLEGIEFDGMRCARMWDHLVRLRGEGVGRS